MNVAKETAGVTTGKKGPQKLRFIIVGGIALYILGIPFFVGLWERAGWTEESTPFILGIFWPISPLLTGMTYFGMAATNAAWQSFQILYHLGLGG